MAQQWTVVATRRQQRMIQAMLDSDASGSTMTPKAKGSVGTGPQREEWSCPKCKLNNWMSRTECRKCATDKPKNKQQPKANKPIATSPAPKKADGTALSMRGLRQDLDYKAALMQDQISKETDDPMMILDGEEGECSTEDSEELQTLIAKPVQELKEELSNLESMILQSRKLGITAGATAMEHRATQLRGALMQKRPQVQQIAHAKALLDKAEKAVQKLDEDLEATRKKVEDMLKERDVQRKRVETTRNAYEDLLRRAQDDLDLEDDEPLAVPSAPQATEIFNRLIMHLPAVQGQLTQDQVQAWLAVAINATMADTYPLQDVADAPAATQQQPMQVQNQHPPPPPAGADAQQVQQHAQAHQQAVPPVLPNQAVQPPLPQAPLQAPNQVQQPQQPVPRGRAQQEREPQDQEEIAGRQRERSPRRPAGRDNASDTQE